MNRYTFFNTSGVAALLLAISSYSVAADEAVDLAAAARDPTASLTAFAIRYDIMTDFYNLPDADQRQIVLQPIIPWKWGDQKHIARVTLPYVTNAPDWGLITEDATGGLPPNYTPTQNQEGLADTAVLDLLILDTSWGRQGIGGTVILPTASDPALGSEKWSIGPAYVAMLKKDNFQGGFLLQWLFSVAGESDRDDVNTVAFQPFGGFGFSGGWSVQNSEMVFNYDLEEDQWNSLPLGIRLEKLVKIGSLPTRMYVDLEHDFSDNEVGPKNTIRFAFVPLL